MDKEYIVYDYKGSIKVCNGHVDEDFLSFEVNSDNKYDYRTRIPDDYMKIRDGKVICRSKDDIPEAITMIEKWREELGDRKSIQATKKLIKDAIIDFYTVYNLINVFIMRHKNEMSEDELELTKEIDKLHEKIKAIEICL